MPASIFGHAYLADLGDLVLEVTFESQSRLTFVVLESSGLAVAGHRETVAASMAEVRPGLFFTSWKERSGSTVTQLQDFANGVLRASVALQDGRCAVLSGTLQRLDAAGDPLAGTGTGLAVRKEIVRRAMEALVTERDVASLERYWTPDCLQHSPLVADGVAGLRAHLASAADGPVWQPHRLIAEGDFVVAHSRVRSPRGPARVVVDVFRFEGRRIAEHWDVVQAEVPATQTASGRPVL
ncbi:MoaF-related domain-containing protein [Streptomyces sp.]|uniref:nuclear transport factor 2 family protein n=1 Tax=Streptomyces sp. TaxID=1931 RepID=UPI002F3F6BE1